MNVAELTKLPFDIQIILAAGYLAYRLATAGLDRTHRAADTVFQVFVYGSVAYLAYTLAKPHAGLAPAMAAAALGALAAAALWRACGRNAVVWVLRKLNVTRENYMPSTWDNIIQSPQTWTYVSVYRDDDVTFESDLANLPECLPLAGIDVDAGGNIALYVTRTIAPNGDVTDFGTRGALDKLVRAHLTYIPARNIKNVTVSFATDLSPSEDSSAGEPPA